MTPRTPDSGHDFDRCKSAFLAVLEHPEPDRERALRTLCGTDPDLERAVRDLLAFHEATETPLDRSPAYQETHPPTRVLADEADQDDAAGAPPVRPGQSLGSYTIDAGLGAGAMGLVFAARHRVTGQPAALKLIRPDASSPRVRRRFAAEGRALARLRHPGIAQVFDAGVAHPDADPTAPALPYIAMELVRGRPITQAARELPRAGRLRLIEQAARAVHHAHLNGVVHRDLKPANMLVDDEGHVKILDFGIAKLTQADHDHAVTTHAGQLIGTPAYMSPEQLGADPAGGGGVDHRADVYALGALLFELLAGRRPIESEPGEDLWSVLRRVEQGPPPLASVDPASRGDLTVITATALRRDPAERYQSAAELADDLARHLASQPIHARPRTRRYVASRFVKRNPWPVALGAAAALAVMAGTAGITMKQRQAAAAEARAVQRFDETRQLARTVLFDLHDAIARLPGSTSARHLLASTAQGYLDRLAADPASDEDLRVEIAEGYLKLGDVLGRTFADNLGDIDGANQNYRAALAILEPLAARPDASARVLATTGRAINALNGTYAATPDPVERVTIELESLALLARAVAQSPDNPGYAAWHTESLFRLGLITKFAGRIDEAHARLDESVRIAGRRLERWPDHRDTRFVAAEANHWHAYILLENDREGAEPLFERAAEICQSILADDPDDTPAAHRLASVWMAQARIAARDADAALAIDRCQAALAVTTRLADRDPDSQYAVRNLGVAHTFAGQIHATLADTAPDHRARSLRTALEHFERSHELLEERAARGWLMPWESHYHAASLEALATTRAALADAEPEQPPAIAAP